MMLKSGGFINIVIAIAHLVGLFWANSMFEVTGIGKEMDTLAEVNASLPYLLTIFVALVFFVFGLYGLSAGGTLRKLPFLKLGIYTIAAIYLFRGVGELIFDMAMQETSSTAETCYSLIAISIGLLFLLGGIKKWKTVK